MNKRVVFLTILIILSIVVLPVTASYASSTTSGVQSWDDMIKDASAFLSKGKNKTVISSGDVSGVVLPIARILVAVASGVLVVVTAVLGVKYATTHDPNEQAKVKRQLIGLVVPIIVVFGGQAIWTIIYNVMKDF